MKKFILLITISVILTGCSFHPPSISFDNPFKIFHSKGRHGLGHYDKGYHGHKGKHGRKHH